MSVACGKKGGPVERAIKKGFELLGLASETDRRRLLALNELVDQEQERETCTFICATSDTDFEGEDENAKLERTAR